MTRHAGGAPLADDRTTLNKRQILAGLRCHKLLWLEFHEREAPELAPDPEAFPRIEEGRLVGEHARRTMGDGVNLAPGHDSAQHAVVERTREAMARGGALLFEAGFTASGASIRADILTRDAPGVGESRDWAMIEVKSSRWPEKERDQERKFDLHVPDVAVQAWVAGESKVAVGTAHLMYLNRECRHPDLSNLFTTVEVTSRVEPVVRALPPAVHAMHGMLRGAGAPDVPVGPQCTDPDECPFYNRCHAPLPDHHVSELYYAKKQAAKFEGAGKTLIAHLDEGDAPNAAAKRQVRAVKSGARVVEQGLRAALGQLKFPIAYLDFETVQLAVPRWPGCRPQDMVAVQFSVHREGFADDRTRNHLAERGGDPRPRLIEELIDACHGASSIVVYYEQFEKSRIRELAEWFPAHELELTNISDRIVDLLPIVRDHVYDSAFHGSFSLKKVLPALVPDLDYSDLAIQDGGAATAGIYRLLFDESLDAAARDSLRADLLAYCHRDTEAMVRLVQTLRGMTT